jgi:hypothetical protein
MERIGRELRGGKDKVERKGLCAMIRGGKGVPLREKNKTKKKIKNLK